MTALQAYFESSIGRPGEDILCIGLDRASSKRQVDSNGWMEIEDNPISKAGVFPYMGRDLPYPGVDPNKVYYVLRPPEEIGHPDFINSVKLMPWIDEHIMLGNKGVSAEEKGVEGVIGEKVHYNKNDETLYGNLKLYSDDLQYKIDIQGKKELSLGYVFKLERKAGAYKGQRYDFIQRNLRANHLALVEKGRMGRDVAVQDEDNISLNNTGSNTMNEEEKQKLAEAEQRVMDGLKDKMGPMIATAMDEYMNKGEGMDRYGTMMEGMMPKMMGSMMEAMMPMMMEAMMKMMGKETAGMDGAVTAEDHQVVVDENAQLKEQIKGFKQMESKVEISALYEDVSAVVGAFDHDDMTLEDVAAYGIEKLGIDCDDKSLHLPLLKNHIKNLPEGYTVAMDKKDDNKGGFKIATPASLKNRFKQEVV